MFLGLGLLTDLFEGIDFSCTLSRARFEELNMDYFRNSMGPGLYGGGLVDADLQVTDPTRAGRSGNDRFAELFPTGNLNIAWPGVLDALLPSIVRGTAR